MYVNKIEISVVYKLSSPAPCNYFLCIPSVVQTTYKIPCKATTLLIDVANLTETEK